MSHTLENDVRPCRATEKKARVSRATAATSGILLKSTRTTSAISLEAKTSPTYTIGHSSRITITLLLVFELTLVRTFVIYPRLVLGKTEANSCIDNKMAQAHKGIQSRQPFAFPIQKTLSSSMS
jgi:hypothetical protein